MGRYEDGYGIKDVYDNAFNIKEAKAKGLEVITPKENELLVDIDSAKDLAIFQQRFKQLSKYIKCSFEITESRSGNYHAYVQLERPVKSEMERLFLQTFLGSDVQRELLSWVRINNNETNSTVFFEKKGSIATVPTRKIRFED
jgi:hypothetical protein